MSAFVELNAKTEDILQANDRELTQLIDKALFDMIYDTMSRYKDVYAPRKITIDLTLVRIDDEQVSITWKVKPTPAPYEKKPEPKHLPVLEGQTTLDLDAPEIDEKTGEVIE